MILKPSAYAKACSAVLAKILRECFEEEYVAVVEGGRKENNELLEQRFDYIFFTGGVTVGKMVMEKASRYLTPITLELGGKSPCIVDESADLRIAARRIAFGKFLNAGQTCVAVDHVFVHSSIRQAFLAYLQQELQSFFGEDVLANPHYPAKERPLALYLFTSRKAVEQRILHTLSFGGGCINDTIIHLATSQMGFGGVGQSGMGSYHGYESFKTFSHFRSIVKKATWLDLPMRYHPYTKTKETIVRMFLR